MPPMIYEWFTVLLMEVAILIAQPIPEEEYELVEIVEQVQEKEDTTGIETDEDDWGWWDSDEE